MKKLISILFVSMFSFAAQAQLDCEHAESFIQSGWQVHDSSSFSAKAKMVKKLVEKGMRDGSVIEDLSGPIRTSQTVTNLRVLLKAETFDDLNTAQNEMFGDYGIMTLDDGSNTVVEVRWYDGVKRHVVFNGKYMRCMMSSAPLADNSVL